MNTTISTNPSPSFGRTVSRCGLSAALALTIAAGASTKAQVSPANPVPIGALVINEVLFDPIGVAGSDGTWQWVELFAKATCSLDGLTLRNTAGRALYTCPNITVPRGGYVVILLGPRDQSIENTNPANGAVVLTAGLPFADHIGVRVGGVKLKNGNAVLDQVGWGTGSTITPVVPIGWPNVPITEGDTIGRDRSGADTDSAADFAIMGGRNSNGPTPGAVNVVEFPDQEGFLLLQDNHVNEVLAGLSQSDANPGWIQVTGTAPVPTSLAISGDTATFTAVHSIQTTVNGTAVTLAGTVQTVFQRTTTSMATSEQYTTSGTLTSAAGYSLDLQLTRSTSGTHGYNPTTSYSADYTWHDGAAAYPVHVSGAKSNALVSDTVMQYTDSRSVVSFGNYGTKTATANATITRLGDGQASCSSTVVRSFPSQLPYPGNDQSWAIGMNETLTESFTMSGDGLGLITAGTVTALNQSVDGVTVRQLQSGTTGTLTSSLTPTANGNDFSYQFTYPVLEFGAATTLTGHLHGSVVTTGTKEVMSGSLDVLQDGILHHQTSFAIDPQGQPQPKSFWQRLGDAVWTTATCVAGGFAATVSVGTMAGKKALIRMVGKSVGKKLIPGLGWICTGVCAAKAILSF